MENLVLVLLRSLNERRTDLFPFQNRQFMLNVEYKTMGQVNIIIYYGGPRDEGKEEGPGD